MRYLRIPPKGAVACWCLNEEEKVKAIKDSKSFINNDLPYLFFSVVNRIDNLYIEGNIGRLDDFGGGEYHKQLVRGLDYFDRFLERKQVYLTFEGATLYQLIEIFPEQPLKLILKRIDNLKAFKKNQAFMIMPFHNDELNMFYDNHLKLFLKSRLQIDLYRDDNFKSNDNVSETIYGLIEESELIIADTTYSNKNAFYELGWAAKSGKEIITIQNKKEEQQLFFDRAHIRTLFYDLDNLDKFNFDLESTITSIRAKF